MTGSKKMKPPKRDYAAIQRFGQWAIEKHGSQMYGPRPYSFHLDQVVMTLDEMGATEDQMMAGYGHDLIEDPQVTHAEIMSQSNQNVADMIWAVSGVGDTREEKLQSVIKKIPTVPGSDWVKLADRYRNFRRSMLDRNWKKIKTYVLEHPVLATVLPPTSVPLRAQLDRMIEEGRELLYENGHLPRPVKSYTDRFMDALEAMCTSRPPEDLAAGWLFVQDDDHLQDWVNMNLSARFNWASSIGLIEAAMTAADQCEEGRPDLLSKEEDRLYYQEKWKASKSVMTL